MKRLILILAICAAPVLLFSQSRITEAEYQKIPRPALINDLPFPSKTIENAIDDAFIKSGYKGSTSKGFTIYKGVRKQELGPDAYDLYFMVERKSRKESDISTVTMMISKGFDAFVSKSSDEQVFNNAQKYLDSLRNTVAAYDLEMQISEQESELKSAEKKYESLLDEEKDLEKKKKKLEDQLADNKKEQQKQSGELENQRQVLEVLKVKRSK